MSSQLLIVDTSSLRQLGQTGTDNLDLLFAGNCPSSDKLRHAEALA